ncbi:MAG: glycosyltransferase, partial [Clostridia bacterium]|nr:glycosyltransferase [Clostridia bacterium]
MEKLTACRQRLLSFGRALDSILRQQCEWGVEIIIGDDCSSDRTADICRDYASR